MKNRIHDNPYFKTGSSSKNFAKKPGNKNSAEVTLKSGGKIPLHYHFDFSEYYEVLEGELKMQVGKEIKTLHKGEYLLIPVKTVHRYFNESGNDVKFKVVIQPGNIGYQLLVSVLNGLARDRK
jgi:mannose-6-phosphate isomerase-like protein (cupin superfamily)